MRNVVFLSWQGDKVFVSGVTSGVFLRNCSWEKSNVAVQSKVDMRPRIRVTRDFIWLWLLFGLQFINAEEGKRGYNCCWGFFCLNPARIREKFKPCPVMSGLVDWIFFILAIKDCKFLEGLPKQGNALIETINSHMHISRAVKKQQPAPSYLHRSSLFLMTKLSDLWDGAWNRSERVSPAFLLDDVERWQRLTPAVPMFSEKDVPPLQHIDEKCTWEKKGKDHFSRSALLLAGSQGQAAKVLLFTFLTWGWGRKGREEGEGRGVRASAGPPGTPLPGGGKSMWFLSYLWEGWSTASNADIQCTAEGEKKEAAPEMKTL